MALVVIALSIAVPLCLVVVLLGCLNCLMKRKPGFSPFSNPNFVEEGTAGRTNDAFSVDMEPTSTPTEASHVSVEPMPDLTPKVVASLPPLRPKILSAEKDSQNANVSFFSSHRPFPRENLTYLNPLGVGWFGQVILSEALRISTDSMRSQVVVKMLKDDASSLEEKQFIDEILPFRHLDHPNVISFLGQCTESRPYLYIVEYAAHGDLKTFLQSYKQNMGTLLKKNKLLHFCLDAAAGVACIHRHNFVHCDLSTRNCLVTSDYKVKIGDYGFAEQSFKEDYFQSGNELLPIRWMAPECLGMKEGGNGWFAQNFSKASDMWSFGVLLWEVFSMAEQPYDMLTDEAVLQGVVIDKVVSLADIPLRVPFHDRLSALMSECWKDPAERISIESTHQVLDEMSKEKVEQVADELDFDQKWNHLIPNTQSRSQSLISEDGSAIALAGSFSSETPYNSDDKPAPSMPPPPAPVEKNDASVAPTASLREETNVVNPIVSIAATPSKMPPQQMTTSTPLADKTRQNKTSFLTSPNTSNSQYITAEEGFTEEKSNSDSINVSVVSDAQEFDDLDSSEWNKTGQESEIDTVGKSVKEDELNSSNENDGKDSAATQDSFAFDDFVSFDSDTNAGQNNVQIEASNKPLELDASFDIIVPSMLDKDQNSDTTSQQMPSPSSQNASLDFVTDFTENNNQSVSSNDNKNPFASMAEEKNTLIHPNEELPAADDSKKELNKPAIQDPVDNLSFESGLQQQSSASINPMTSSSTNPFSTGEITANTSTSPSFQDAAAIFSDKSDLDLDASSSLNSTSLLGGWDTSFPESSSHSQDPAKDATQNPLQQQSDGHSSLFFAEDDSEDPNGASSPVVSSDFSFLEDAPPAVSGGGVVDSTPAAFPTATLTTGNATTESLFSGFEPTTTATNTSSSFPSSTSNPMDDLFGSAVPSSQPLETTTTASSSSTTTSTTTQPSFFDDEGTKTAATPVPDFQAAAAPSSSSDPFDFSAFETAAGGSVSVVDDAPHGDTQQQQKPTTGIDLFSSDFDAFGKTEPDRKDQEEGEIETVPSSSSTSTSDFPGLDLFSGGGGGDHDLMTSPSAASNSNPGTADGGLMFGGVGGDLLTSVPPSNNQVGTSPVSKYDDHDSNSFHDQSEEEEEEEEESGVVNSCQSLTENSSTFPTAAMISGSDSCYTSGVVTDSRNGEEEVSSSSCDEISSRAFAVSDSGDDHVGYEADSNHIDHSSSDSTEVEENSSSICDADKTDLQSYVISANDSKSSNSEESNSSSDETSSTSGSEREYICVNPFDTGQPPTTPDPDHDDKENLDPDNDYFDKDVAFDDLNEQDLKIVSDIYLSRGVKSPRVFEVPTLETIPEHQTLHSRLSEDTIATPSETSSVGPRDDELFGSDSYEWDDFYGDSLIGKDDTGPEMDEEVRQSPIGGDQNNISNWSLDFEADSNSNSSHHNFSNNSSSSRSSSSVLSTTTLNRSDPACSSDNDIVIKSSISDHHHKVQSLSDSELFTSKNSTNFPSTSTNTTAPPTSPTTTPSPAAVASSSTVRPSLVASTLAKHRNRSMMPSFSSPLSNSSRGKGSNFYSLMEDLDDFQLDSSQEEISSPVNLSDDDEFAFAVDTKSRLSQHLHLLTVSSSSFPSTSSTPPALPPAATVLNNSPSSSLSPPSSPLSSSSSSPVHALYPKKSSEVLAIDKEEAMTKELKGSSSPNTNSASLASSDLLGLGFDSIMPMSNDDSNSKSDDVTSSAAVDQNLFDGSLTMTTTTTPSGNMQQGLTGAAAAESLDPFDSLI